MARHEGNSAPLRPRLLSAGLYCFYAHGGPESCLLGLSMDMWYLNKQLGKPVAVVLDGLGGRPLMAMLVEKGHATASGMVSGG